MPKLSTGFAVDLTTMHGRRAIENAVMLTYTANRAYAQVLGDASFKPYAEAEAWQLDSNRAGIMKLLEDPDTTPEESHSNWMEAKRKDGWTVGHVKDPEAKIHPCMVPYAKLPVDQRAKDHLFLGIARQALLTYGGRTAWFSRRTIENVALKFECTNRDFDLGMLVAHGRTNRIVAAALGGLYLGFDRPMLATTQTINDAFAEQVACAMVSTTPELAYSAYRANKWPVELPDLLHSEDSRAVAVQDTVRLRRAHWWIMHAVAMAVMEIEGVDLKQPRVALRSSSWSHRNAGVVEQITVELHEGEG